MGASGSVGEAAGNLARVIDAQRLRARSAWKIDLVENTIRPQQPVLNAPCIGKCPHNVVTIVESHGLGSCRAGKIELCEDPLAEEKAVLRPGMVKEETRDLAAGIDVVCFRRGGVGNIKKLEVERSSLRMCRHQAEEQNEDGEIFCEHESILLWAVKALVVDRLDVRND